MVSERTRPILITLNRAISVNGELATMFEFPPIPVTMDSGETLVSSQSESEKRVEPRAENIPDREADVVDVSRMTDRQFEIHLSSLIPGFVTVKIESLREMRDDVFCEELAQSPFNRPIINVDH